MSLIGAKRMQQGVFEALAGMNRAAGSGGGIGMQVVQNFAGSQVSNVNLTTTSMTLISGSQVSFLISRPGLATFQVLARALTTGASGQYAYLELWVDGVSQAQAGVWDKANLGFCQCTLSYWLKTPIQPGSHTADLRCQVDNGQTLNLNLATLNGYLGLQ